MKHFSSTFALLAVLMPALVYAQQPRTFKDLMELLTGILNSFIPILFTVIIAFFFWGVIKVVFAEGDTSKLGEGKKYMVYGIISLFVTLSVWGIVNVVQRSIF